MNHYIHIFSATPYDHFKLSRNFSTYAALPVLSGQTTIGSGGTAGSLALTSLSSGVHTCTAGGSGTSCIGSTKVTITID